MSKKIELEAIEHIPEYTGILDDGNTITIKDGHEWNGHAYADKVGRIYNESGKVESFFKADCDNGNTDIFDRLRNDIHLITKEHNVMDRDTYKLYYVTDYYIPYRVKEHCSSIPTVINTHVDGCMNVNYEVEYEIIFAADDDYIRYFTAEYKTYGGYAVSFYEELKNIEEMFEEWMDEESHGFHRDEYDELCLDFYDSTGEKIDVAINSIDELLSMITSVRVIKLDRKIMDRTNN